MKITKEHYKYMKTRVNSYIKTNKVNVKQKLKEYEQHNLSRKRFNWDLLIASQLYTYIVDVLYKEGYTDKHIDTAINKIVNSYL